MLLQERLLAGHEEGVGAEEAAYPASLPNQRYYGSTQPHPSDSAMRPRRMIPSRPQSSYLKNSSSSTGTSGLQPQIKNSRKSIRKSSAVDEKVRSQNQRSGSAQRMVKVPKAQPMSSQDFNDQLTSMFRNITDSLQSIQQAGSTQKPQRPSKRDRRKDMIRTRYATKLHQLKQ